MWYAAFRHESSLRIEKSYGLKPDNFVSLAFDPPLIKPVVVLSEIARPFIQFHTSIQATKFVAFQLLQREMTAVYVILIVARNMDLILT